MLIVDYVLVIRSERRLRAEVQVSLKSRSVLSTVRSCNLGIEDKIPEVAPS
jgi:hypothetical protein